MTKDELKKELHRYHELEEERQQILAEIQRLGSYKSPTIDGMPRGSGISDPTGNTATQHIALLNRYQAQLTKLDSAQAHIEDMIESLEPMERKLMRHRYIECKTWETVCVMMNYSWRQTHRIHGRILDKLIAAAE